MKPELHELFAMHGSIISPPHRVVVVVEVVVVVVDEVVVVEDDVVVVVDDVVDSVVDVVDVVVVEDVVVVVTIRYTVTEPAAVNRASRVRPTAMKATDAKSRIFGFGLAFALDSSCSLFSLLI